MSYFFRNENSSTKVCLEFISPFKKWLAGLFLVTIGLAISTSTTPFALKKLLNFLASSTIQNDVLSIKFSAFFYVMLSLFPVLVFRLHNFIWVNLAPSLKRYTTANLMNRITSYPYHFFQNQPGSNIASTIKDLTDAIPNLIKTIFDGFFCGFLTLLVAVITVNSVGYKYAIGLTAWITIFVFVSILVLKKAKILGKQGIESRAKLQEKTVEILENIKCIKLLDREKFEQSKLERELDKCLLIDQQKEKCIVKAFAFQGFSFVAYQCICIFWLITDLKLDLIKIGDFVLILTINLAFVDSFRKLSQYFAGFGDLWGNIQQGLKILILPKESKENKAKQDIEITEGQIVFDNVSFNYKGAPSFFNNKSIRIEAGETVAIVGLSGSGKSTFVNLILRLYDVTSGSIKIDEHNIEEISNHSLRKSFSVVPQSPSLFHGTLMENIRYGKVDASDAEVMEAAKKAELDDFILTLPLGYQTHVDSFGLKLSAGQRQRIAIARSILKDAPILILDEAMSHLDTITEGRIQESLLKLSHKKTTILITHRPSSVLFGVHKILVFENGIIVENGTHDDLLKREGLYKKLWTSAAN